MKVVKYKHLTPELVKQFTDLLSTSFRRNEFIYSYLMGENPRILRHYMKAVVSYNNHFADYYALVRESGEWVAAVIYLPAGCESLGLSSAIKHRKLLQLLRFFVMQPLKYTKRMIRFSELEEKHWLKEPFVTLEVLGSLEKGCGTTLINETIQTYCGQNVALNSSVTQDNHTYYRQFGFEAYTDIQLDDYKTVMMVKGTYPLHPGDLPD